MRVQAIVVELTLFTMSMGCITEIRQKKHYAPQAGIVTILNLKLENPPVVKQDGKDEKTIYLDNGIHWRVD